MLMRRTVCNCVALLSGESEPMVELRAGRLLCGMLVARGAGW